MNTSAPRKRRRTFHGFTLVELMVTMVIITILASALLFAMHGAQESARAAKTRSTINKIHNLLMDRWESYRTRRLPLSPDRASDPLTRLRTTRELMRMEMPERYTDIIDDPFYLPNRPSISFAYLRRLDSNSDRATVRFQGAECLYMVITMGAEDETGGVERFRNSEIGDADGDGMKEFHDGWGSPIGFLRWAPGFSNESSIQSDDLTDPMNRDPFDPRGIGQGFALFPLVYSAGPDGGYGIAIDIIANDRLDSLVTEVSGEVFHYRDQRSDPFKPYVNGEFIGTPDISGLHLDNIHNHFLTTN